MVRFSIRSMKTNIKFILNRTKKDSQGYSPIYLRITKNRQSAYISYGSAYKIDTKHWDDKGCKVKTGHPNSTRLNNQLSRIYHDTNSTLLELEGNSPDIDVQEIKAILNGNDKKASFSQFFKGYIDDLEKKDKIGMMKKAKAVNTKLNEYMRDKEILFQHVTPNFLNEYEEFLRASKGNGVNTIHNNLKIFRKLFNDAVRDGLVPYEQNPFLKYRLRTEKTESMVFLLPDEIKRVEDLNFPGDVFSEMVRDMFLFSIYCAGIRISDILTIRWANFDGIYLSFRMQKTKETIHIKVPKKALEILRRYRKHEGQNDSRIFPVLEYNESLSSLEQFQKISTAKTIVNAKLKLLAVRARIKKKISFHVARHTFATLALRSGISIFNVSKLLGHRDIKTTLAYTKVINEDLDKAMDRLNFS